VGAENARMSNHTGRLVLTTADPLTSPDAAPLIAALSACGFIGDPLPGLGAAFAVGRDFLSLLSFGGCAVAIATAPGDDRQAAFCYVQLPDPAPAPRLLWGRNTRPPRCPGCRARFLDWREHILERSSSLLTGVTCIQCDERRPPWCWDWKEQGGFGRRFILVEEVFPGEAVPTARLFQVLTAVSGSNWRHFFVQD
jgi:hypothetical protein